MYVTLSLWEIAGDAFTGRLACCEKEPPLKNGFLLVPASDASEGEV